MSGWWIFLFVYIFFNFLLSLYVYNKSKKFYDPKSVYDENENCKVDWHHKYRDFRKSDEFSWLRIFIGLNLFFWIKVFLLISTAIVMMLFLK